MLQGDATSANVAPARYAMASGGSGSDRTSMSMDGRRRDMTPSKLQPMTMATADAARGRVSLRRPAHAIQFEMRPPPALHAAAAFVARHSWALTPRLSARRPAPGRTTPPLAAPASWPGRTRRTRRVEREETRILQSPAAVDAGLALGRASCGGATCISPRRAAHLLRRCASAVVPVASDKSDGEREHREGAGRDAGHEARAEANGVRQRAHVSQAGLERIGCRRSS